jgi:hypothetical protein
MQARFSSLFRLTRIGHRMVWSTEASVSCNNLSVAVTHDHADSASSPTHPQLMDRVERRERPTGTF